MVEKISEKTKFVLKMAFSNREYAEMHYVYGLCDGNASAAKREYRTRYPDRQIPSPQVFTRLHQRLIESGSVQKQKNEVGPALDVYVEEHILERVREDPEISSRRLAAEIGVSKHKVLQTLHKNNFYPYHFTKVQGLEPGDFLARQNFCRYLLNCDIEQYGFFRKILWTDESLFTRQGVFNFHNMHVWSEDNPHATREMSFQTRFSVNVWAGVIGNQFLGPHIFQGNLNGATYLHFLQNDLPRILEDVAPEQRQNIIYQQDGAPPHYTLEVRAWLDANYPGWIGRGGDVAWPARSPDLNPMDFYVWGYLKDHVYATPVNNEVELVTRIRNCCEMLRENLTFKVTVGSMRKRARACIRENGGHFEQKLR